MATTGRLGTNDSQGGNIELGAAGYSSIASAPVSTLTRGAFVQTVPVWTNTTKIMVNPVVVNGQVVAYRRNTLPVTAQVKSVNTRTIPVQGVILGNLGVVTSVTGLTSASVGPMEIPSTVALFPAAPEVYKGRVPRRSTLVPDLMSLLPQYYDVQPGAAKALEVGIATATPPSVATNASAERFNPLAAPIALGAESVGGEFISGAYEVGYTFYTGTGETTLSPVTTVNIDRQRSMGISIAAIPVPTGIQSVRYYLRSPSSSLFTLAAVSVTGHALVLVREGQTVNVRIDGTRFEVVATDGEVPAFACDLRDFTLGSLVFQLQNSGYLARVEQDWASLAATVLIDQFCGPSALCTLDGFTSTLWRIIRPIALCFDQWTDDLDETARQMDVRYASGRWLDWWGVLYGVVRRVGESDAQYRRRITWEVMAPRANNVAMEIILKEAMGYDSLISDMAGSATTWYTNKVVVGTPIRDISTGAVLRFTTDPQGELIPGLASWDYTASYNTSTRTWTAQDYQPLTWGQKLVGAVPVEAEYIHETWPGTPGRFHVDIRQVVEEGELGVEEIRSLINRYKAAGFLFTISVLTYYREEYLTGKDVKETYREDWQESGKTPAGTFHTTMTLASLTMQLTPPPLREAVLLEEWSYDAGTTFRKEGSTAALERHTDAEGYLPLLLAGTETVKTHPPGVVPPG